MLSCYKLNRTYRQQYCSNNEFSCSLFNEFQRLLLPASTERAKMRQRFRDEEKDCYLDEILEDKKIILNKLSRIMFTIRQEFPTCTHSLISFLLNHNLDEFYKVSINRNLRGTPPNLDSSSGHNDLLGNLSTTYIRCTQN